MTKPSIFFPEPMNSIEIICPKESAYHCISALARHGIVQLNDCNAKGLQTEKRYTENYMQCEEAERSLRFIESHLTNDLDQNGQPYIQRPPTYEDYIATPNNMNLVDTLAAIKEADEQLHDKVDMYQQLTTQRMQNQYKLFALRFYRPLVEDENIARSRRLSDTNSLELSILNDTTIISSVTGLCPSEKFRKMISTVYRTSRRNIIYRTGDTVNNLTPYLIFVSSSAILGKIIKIAESYSQWVYEFPSDPSSLTNLENEMVANLEQMDSLSANALEVNNQYLHELSLSFWRWRAYIAQEKQIWMTMDYGDFQSIDSVIYKGWCPRRFCPLLENILETARQESGSPVPIQIRTVTAETILATLPDTGDEHSSEVVVPTYIQKNQFTKAFQTLNDSYGVPNYDELNGGAFYCMYPFLFAIMFGDVGHAIFYILAALALLILDPIVKKKGLDLGDIGGSIFGFKWLVVFAAVCSLYCGFVYNECFGLPFSFFKSNWVLDKSRSTDSYKVWKQDGENIYPFGIDPTWYFKDNELIFLNSYKMKLSVVMGMLQMVFGMFLQLINHIHRKSLYEILVKWIPQMLYLVPFFGYLVVIIILKWCTDFKNGDFPPEEQENGVNLIQVMIGMILNIGSPHDISLQLYPDCWTIQNVIVVIFVLSIPYMLLVKPICECVKRRHQANFSVLEIFVMNLIDVIEFALGALSHTASYLRLWALSLAHSQLSHVIYDELFVLTLNMGNPVFTFIGFAAFATLSAAILLAMEAFSALLHAIRLMWVEFSSKFYSGMGTAFKALSLKKALKKVGIKHQ